MNPLLLLLACAPQGPADPAPGLTLARCHLSGLDEETRCGTLPVPEDPASPQGRQVPLRVVVLPARNGVPRPDPVFFLAGGPGQASTRVVAQVLPALDELRDRYDLVFVDSRGTGDSNGLSCPLEGPQPPSLFQDPMSVDAQDCLARLQARADLTQYGTSRAVDDLDAVAQALGATQVNVVGGSYGTRLALEWARRHPQRVRTLVLDGVAPPPEPVLQSTALDAQASLDKTFAACAADPACAAAFPDPQADLNAALATLPATVTLRHPREGSMLTAELGRDNVMGLIRGILYSPDLSALLPLSVHAAAQGDWGPLAAQAETFSAMEEVMSGGLTLSVICSEDLPRYQYGQAEHTLWGDSPLLAYQRACEGWPRAEVDPSFFEPVRSEAPTLLLSGGLDPATPPRLAEQAAQTLPNSVHGLAPEAGHGVLSTTGCIDELIGDLIQSGSTEGLDKDCLLEVERPAFFVSPAGPAMGEVDAAR